MRMCANTLAIFTEMMSVKKELKRARLFEVQKITKRLRVLEKRRGTETQIEKNRRKVQRLQQELEFIKDVNLTSLCSSIEAKDGELTQLARLKEPPGDLREKVKWRLLTSKPVVDSLNELMSKVYPEAAKTKHSGRPKLPAAGNRLSDDQSQTDEHLASLVEEGVPSGELSRDGLNSVFVSSLSAHASSVISHARGGGSRRDGAKERVPHKKRKTLIKRNRLGQRARRKLWEEKYGRKAKHLTRIGSKRKNVKARKETLSVEAGERENLGSVEVLHPSWAAKRQQRAAIEQFQGQKIVFDSD